MKTKEKFYLFFVVFGHIAPQPSAPPIITTTMAIQTSDIQTSCHTINQISTTTPYSALLNTMHTSTHTHIHTYTYTHSYHPSICSYQYRFPYYPSLLYCTPLLPIFSPCFSFPSFSCFAFIFHFFLRTNASPTCHRFHMAVVLFFPPSLLSLPTLAHQPRPLSYTPMPQRLLHLPPAPFSLVLLFQPNTFADSSTTRPQWWQQTHTHAHIITFFFLPQVQPPSHIINNYDEYIKNNTQVDLKSFCK